MNSGGRICCVWLPRFALAVASHHHSLHSSLITHHSSLTTHHSSLARSALYRPGTRWQELLECSPDLEAAGVRPGLPLKEAQARFPDATYLPCDATALDVIARAFEMVVDALDAFSPIVEPAPRESLGAGRAVAYVDVAGLGPLYGPEPQLAARLATAASAAFESFLSQLTHHSSLITHHSARAGIAASKFTAWVAASLAGQFAGEEQAMVVPPGEEATFLAPLPLETLPLSLRDRQALHRLGVETLGQFAKLPANAVQHRYGAAGRHARQLAQGLDAEPLRPRQPRPAASVEMTFDWEETELDRLTFALKMLADQLAARLAALGNGEEAEDEDLESEGEAETSWPDDAAQPWPDEADEEATRDPGAQPLVGFGAKPQDNKDSPSPLRWRGGGGVRSAPTHAAEALRVTWRLAGGETREALLRLAEPASSAAVFTEHLRWHAEGLDRFLAPAATSVAVAPPEPNVQNELPPTKNTKLPNELPSPDEPQPEKLETHHSSLITHHSELTYQPLEQRVAVRGIALEAVGIQVPGGTQLKLLASPLQLGAGATSRLDPVMRATQARRAIARLRARWSDTSSTGVQPGAPPGSPPARPPVVWQPSLTTSRLPEHAFQRMSPQIGMQVDETAGGALSTLPSPREGEGKGVRGDRYSPLLNHTPFWLVNPPEPALLLQPRRKGGRPILALGVTAAPPSKIRAPVPAGDPESEIQNPESRIDPSPARPRRPKRELRILRRGGPWKLVDPSCLISGAPLTRDYYQVEAEDGRAYLIFWDRVSDTWFLQGIFD